MIQLFYFSFKNRETEVHRFKYHILGSMDGKWQKKFKIPVGLTLKSMFFSLEYTIPRLIHSHFGKCIKVNVLIFGRLFTCPIIISKVVGRIITYFLRCKYKLMRLIKKNTLFLFVPNKLKPFPNIMYLETLWNYTKICPC